MDRKSRLVARGGGEGKMIIKKTMDDDDDDEIEGTSETK